MRLRSFGLSQSNRERSPVSQKAEPTAYNSITSRQHWFRETLFNYNAVGKMVWGVPVCYLSSLLPHYITQSWAVGSSTSFLIGLHTNRSSDRPFQHQFSYLLHKIVLILLSSFHIVSLSALLSSKCTHECAHSPPNQVSLTMTNPISIH